MTRSTQGQYSYGTNTTVFGHGTPTQIASAQSHLHDTLRRLKSFKSLPENWNSYGGSPVESAAIQSTIECLSEICRDSTIPIPSIAPNSDGEIVLAWDNGWALDVTVEKSGRLHYAFYWGDLGVEEEGITRNPLRVLTFLIPSSIAPY